MEVFVSSACFQEKDLKKVIVRLKELGYDSIELTGGIKFTSDIYDTIENLATTESINVQLHNYSPPVENDFVLNIASLDPVTFQRSYSHVQSTLNLVEKLGLGKYAVHAGFYIPIETNELGKVIGKRDLYDQEHSYGQFVDTVNEFYSKYAKPLYIENNVVSNANYHEYQKNPFMLTCADEYFELKERIPQLKLLLDLAHLKVSCNTLGLSFHEEVFRLINETDYLHISDNDGLTDSNQGLVKESEMYEILKNAPLGSKTITLEVYSGEEDLRRSFQLVNHLQ